MRLKILLFTTLFIILTTFTYGQSFEDLNNMLLCNAYTYGKADSTTKEFLKENFPYLTMERPKGQIIKPPIGRDSKESIITLRFQKHPFFNFNTTECLINFKTVETPGQPKFETDAELYLFFQTQKSADSAFTKLIELYKPVSTNKDIILNEVQKTGKFTGEKLEYYTPRAYLELTKNETNGYKIYFRRWFSDN